MVIRKGIMALESAQIDQQTEAAEVELLAEMQVSEEESSRSIPSTEQDEEFQKLTQAEEITNSFQESIMSTVEASTSLEAMASELSRAIDDGGMNIHGIRFANLAIESMNRSYGIEATKLAISTEDYKKDPLGALKTAMEDMQTQSQGLWSSISEKITGLANALVNKLTSFKKNIVRLEKRASEVERIIEGIDKDAPMRFGALKPQDWFIDLSYHGKAAPKGLVGIASAVEKLLKETSSVMISSVGKYNDWIKANNEKALNDPAVFNSLKYRTSDFLILNQKHFDDKRRVITSKANEGYSHYRSNELPGGMALYAHLGRTDQTGTGVISSLNELDYRIAPFDPVSYNLVKGVIATAAGMVIGAFVGAAIGLGIAVPVAISLASSHGALVALGAGSVLVASGKKTGQTVGGAIGFKSAYDKDINGNAYGNKLKLTKDMLFETLTLVEAKRVLVEVRKGIAEMKTWEAKVFKEVYKDKEATALIERMLQVNDNQGNATSVRMLKNLCFAIFNLQTGMSGQTLSYSIRTYNSMLSYVQKSSYQYA